MITSKALARPHSGVARPPSECSDTGPGSGRPRRLEMAPRTSGASPHVLGPKFAFPFPDRPELLSPVRVTLLDSPFGSVHAEQSCRAAPTPVGLHPGTEDHFSFVLVVARAPERDVVHRGPATERPRNDVVVLQEVPFRAAPAVA